MRGLNFTKLTRSDVDDARKRYPFLTTDIRVPVRTDA